MGSFGAEIMVNDRKAAQKLYPDLVIEPAALEQIMIFYVNRIVAVVMLGACRKKKLRKYNNA